MKPLVETLERESEPTIEQIRFFRSIGSPGAVDAVPRLVELTATATISDDLRDEALQTLLAIGPDHQAVCEALVARIARGERGRIALHTAIDELRRFDAESCDAESLLRSVLRSESASIRRRAAVTLTIMLGRPVEVLGNEGEPVDIRADVLQALWSDWKQAADVAYKGDISVSCESDRCVVRPQVFVRTGDDRRSAIERSGADAILASLTEFCAHADERGFSAEPSIRSHVTFVEQCGVR